eukprot:4613252-Pyramimonas_sp.AAC.1
MRRVQPTAVTEKADGHDAKSSASQCVQLDGLDQGRPRRCAQSSTEASDEQLQEMVDNLLALEGERDDALHAIRRPTPPAGSEGNLRNETERELNY